MKITLGDFYVVQLYTTKMGEKSPNFFYCKTCDYTTSNKKDFIKHQSTRKHENTTKYNVLGIKIPKNLKIYECKCGKSYPYRGSLYNHKKTCEYNIHIIDDSNNNDVINDSKNNILIDDSKNIDYKDMFLTMIKENKELQNVLITQQSQINQLIPKIGNQIIGDNNTINNKHKININIFLNEQCKDALTMNEFIDKIKININDLMITKNKGLSEGVSNIFIENMNKLSLRERPMHCTDMKRETVYIKCDNTISNGQSKWEKDEENNILKEAFKKVSHVQQKNLDKWTKEHPNWRNNSDEQKEYMKLVKNCTDDLHENKREDKAIRKVCNQVYIGENINDIQ